MVSVSNGIAGSIVREDYFQEYLGMRNEYVDRSEFNRRLNGEIFDKEEFKIILIINLLKNGNNTGNQKNRNRT